MWRPVEVAAIVTLLVVGSFIVEMLQKENLTITGIGTTIFGVMYVSWLMGHLILLISVPYGKVYTFVLFFSTWVGDGAAYIVGRKIGKRKLIPRISPNKTVEGAVAGLATTLLAVVALKTVEFREPLSYYIRINGSQLDFKELMPGFSYLDAIILGFLISAFGQIGDLSESLIKRDAGVKDSGGIFPGHGGALDVIDSLIFTGPVMYYYWFFIVSGR
jgi:phosphatidate cytidylyltransferase